MNDQKDYWKHRGLKMKCSTCMWFCLKKKSCVNTDKDNDSIEIERCRRHTPTVMNEYPVVFLNDCGDHKLNEDAL